MDADPRTEALMAQGGALELVKFAVDMLEAPYINDIESDEAANILGRAAQLMVRAASLRRKARDADG